MSHYIDKEPVYNNLIKEVENCKLCPNVYLGNCLLNEKNGPLNADLLFIGTAPGKVNPNYENKPFAGGAATTRFNGYLEEAKIDRKKIFITNAVLHTPIDFEGEARNPNSVEVDNCREWLKQTIRIVDPKILVPLGSIALEAVNALDDHGLVFRQHVGKMITFGHFKLFALPHPSPLSRYSMDDQAQMYFNLKKQYDEVLKWSKI